MRNDFESTERNRGWNWLDALVAPLVVVLLTLIGYVVWAVVSLFTGDWAVAGIGIG